MNIGRVGLWTFLLDEHPTSRVRDVVQEIEGMGWPTLWRPESTGRDVLVASSVMLDATSRLIVASGIAQIYARHPVTTAAAPTRRTSTRRRCSPRISRRATAS